MKLKKIEWAIIAGIIILAFGIAWALDENITVSFTPVGLTAAKYSTFTHGVCVVETGAIRFTMDGVTVPTSGGVGVPVAVGGSINFTIRDHLTKFSAVRDTSTSAKLSCTYW
jgi:hypothetical protein